MGEISKVYGYCRCSTNESKQDVEYQIKELVEKGIKKELNTNQVVERIDLCLIVYYRIWKKGTLYMLRILQDYLDQQNNCVVL